MIFYVRDTTRKIPSGLPGGGQVWIAQRYYASKESAIEVMQRLYFTNTFEDAAIFQILERADGRLSLSLRTRGNAVIYEMNEEPNKIDPSRLSEQRFIQNGL